MTVTRRGLLATSGLALLGKKHHVNQPQPLWQPSANVTLDGSGNGIANLGPQRAREHWQLASISVSVSKPVTSEARCYVFVGSNLSSATFLGATFTGSTGDQIPCGGFDIQPGMQVWAQWVGGDPGNTATVNVNGTYTIGPPPFQAGALIGSFRNQLLPFFQAGNTVVIDSKGFRLYNGTPAAGNLIVSDAPAAGTDNFGNAFPQGAAAIGTGAFAGTWIDLLNNQILFHHSGPGTDGFIAHTTLGAGYQLNMNSPTAAADSPATFGLRSQQASGTGRRIALVGADVDLGTIGDSFNMKEGANGRQGIATLVAGTVTVATTNITANSRVQLTAQDNNTTGALRVSARIAGTSFTITSSNAADTGVVAYVIAEPSI